MRTYRSGPACGPHRPCHAAWRPETCADCPVRLLASPGAWPAPCCACAGPPPEPLCCCKGAPWGALTPAWRWQVRTAVRQHVVPAVHDLKLCTASHLQMPGFGKSWTGGPQGGGGGAAWPCTAAAHLCPGCRRGLARGALGVTGQQLGLHSRADSLDQLVLVQEADLALRGVHVDVHVAAWQAQVLHQPTSLHLPECARARPCAMS